AALSEDHAGAARKHLRREQQREHLRLSRADGSQAGLLIEPTKSVDHHCWQPAHGTTSPPWPGLTRPPSPRVSTRGKESSAPPFAKNRCYLYSGHSGATG